MTTIPTPVVTIKTTVFVSIAWPDFDGPDLKKSHPTAYPIRATRVSASQTVGQGPSLSVQGARVLKSGARGQTVSFLYSKDVPADVVAVVLDRLAAEVAALS